MSFARRCTVAVCLGVAAAVAVGAVPWGTGETFDTQADTIFVSVASYRDAVCVDTVKALFEMASHPERVFVGVCEQNQQDSEACIPRDFKWAHRVRRLTIPHTEAKGPTYARYLCSTLYRGETYFCQIDSHSKFAKGWDAEAVAMLRACPSKKAVLSHYPHDWSEAQGGNHNVPVLCKSAFDKNGVPTFEAVALAASKAPKPVPFTSGGFVFGPGTMLTEVAYDPDLPHLFQGEEILYSARLWTSGYDFFTPTTNIVYHQYGRDSAPKFWGEVPGFADSQKATYAKVTRLLTGAGGAYKYGMGTVRTLAAYWEFAGIDWKSKTSSSEKKFCV